MSRYPAAIGMKRARDKDTGGYLWHSRDGGRLYETSDHYYLCASCDVAQRDPYVGSSRAVTITWQNVSPGPEVET